MLDSRLGRWVAFAVALVAVGAVALAIALLRESHTANVPERLRPLEVDSAAALEHAFDALGYHWPPSAEVPRVGVVALPEDLAELPVGRRKSVFFRALTPLILAENARLRVKREHLVAVAEGAPATEELREIATRYGVESHLSDQETAAALLRHVDEIPLGMALAQAAIESGWGTSRFTREARNLFGVWTWDAEHGIEPLARPVGATHFVRVFPDLQHAVRNFLFTLNAGHTYVTLRSERARLRAAQQPLDPLVLAGGLERYSQRGEVYVHEVRAMIRSNRLNELDALHLSDPLPDRALLRP